MMRVAAGIGVLAMLAGCGEQAPSAKRQDGKAVAANGAPVDDGMADCALAGSREWARTCSVERAGKLLTLRHPDGGFRRFRMLDDGRGLEAADGAEAARLTILDDRRIEIVTGDDRYRLPAQIDAVAR
ncbi:hypothetical protein [Sphingobium sp.]|uniref:hypothetical protein n=1 Tax=Sphingobium sp. TaxID=1912891 RepID=UPI003B3B754E